VAAECVRGERLTGDGSGHPRDVRIHNLSVMGDVAIEVRGLRKSYGPNEAVRGVDLQVEVGEVFALLGPNGAGKTTTVEILEGHRQRSAGEVRVLGHDPGRGDRAFKERIGIVLQEKGIERYLRVEEVIDLYRGYFPNPRPLDEVIAVVGLEDKRKARVGKLSGGQQRRLDVAIGLAGDPDLLFLDEPTTGFDPSARRGAWEMVKNLQGLGKTIFLTTHYMEEAQYLADRVAVMTEGRIVAEGAPAALAAMDGGNTTVAFTLPAGAPPLPDDLRATMRNDGDRFHATTNRPTPLLHALTAWALASGIELESLRVSPPSLEDVYLRLTGWDAAAESNESA
jgi:ABC-2 type transport system ATP-binding protein